MRIVLLATILGCLTGIAACKCDEGCSDENRLVRFEYVGADTSIYSVLVKRYKPDTIFSEADILDSSYYYDLRKVCFDTCKKSGVIFEFVCTDTVMYQLTLSNGESAKIRALHFSDITCQSCSQGYFIEQFQSATITTNGISAKTRPGYITFTK